MKKVRLRNWTACLALFLILHIPAAGEETAHTRDEVRAYWQKMAVWDGESPYFAEPCLQNGAYQAGSLDEGILHAALDRVNFYRYLAYLNQELRLDDLYGLRAQNAALLLAADDILSHDPPRPEGMSDLFYESARLGAHSSNLAKLNWIASSSLLDAVEYFVRDDGERNAMSLSHRRWLLNPALSRTGFGLALSESGNTYAVMSVEDSGGDDGEWTYAAWPSRGAFPAELLREKLMWSVSLNPEIYEEEQPDAEIRVFLNGEIVPLMDVSYSTEACGTGSCLIFRPDLLSTGEENYEQNQVWRVEIGGLIRPDGVREELEYEVELMSLYPVDPSAVEVEPQSASLRAGETLRLSAQVVPRWADDCSVTWVSDCPEIARVDENGVVTAVSPGYCAISARSANGKEDRCAVTVDVP